MSALEPVLDEPKNQFYLPSVGIDEKDLKGGQVEAIGEDEKRNSQRGKAPGVLVPLNSGKGQPLPQRPHMIRYGPSHKDLKIHVPFSRCSARTDL